MGRKSGDDFELRKNARSRYWQVRFSVPGYGQVERSTRHTSKTDAKRKAKKIFKAANDEAKRRASIRIAVPFDDMADDWLAHIEQTKSESWHRTAQIYVNRWCKRWSCLSELTRQSIGHYASDRLRSVSGRSLAKDLSALRIFLDWCVAQGAIAEAPKVEAPRWASDHKPFWLCWDDVQKILKAMPSRAEHRKHHPVREYFQVMCAGGFRAGTMASLRWEDLDEQGMAIHIRASGDKRAYARTVPLTPDAMASLASLKEDGRVGRIFGRQATSGQTVPPNYSASLKSAAKAAGIEEWKKVSPRSLRHSWLTEMCSKTKNVTAVMHMAGHRNISTTGKYVHSGLENARELLIELGFVSREVSRELELVKQKPE